MSRRSQEAAAEIQDRLVDVRRRATQLRHAAHQMRRAEEQLQAAAVAAADAGAVKTTIADLAEVSRVTLYSWLADAAEKRAREDDG